MASSDNGGDDAGDAGIASAMDAELASIESDLSEVARQMAALQNRKAALEKKRTKLKERMLRAATEKLHRRDWENETFPWSEKLREKLSSTFGLSSFRPLQLSAVNAVLSGHDVYLVMPTGGGKSLCYQLPALATDGLTLVVSPLVSLMEDQVMALKRNGVEGAEMLNADTPREEVTRILNAMVDKNSGLKLLYVTPERMAKSKRFMTKLQASHKAARLARIAIDEVHCCSQWGHDFRPDYKYLGVLKTLFPGIPLIGLTATATARITEDCCKMLGMESSLVFRAPFNRPNLYYEVRTKPDSQEACVQELADLLSGEFAGQSGIIYTLSIKDAETLAESLSSRGLRVAPYHANLPSSTRSKVHRKWLSGAYQAVSATIAFGMGIDKPDVRFVIHHCVSKSMENYYQESGRAGRDDAPARCLVYYRMGDIFRVSPMVFTERTGLEKLYGMMAFCANYRRCRRGVIAEHFGEAWEGPDPESAGRSGGCCDVCSGLAAGRTLPCFPELAQAALRGVEQAARTQDAKLTALKLSAVLLGKGEARYRVKGWTKGPELDRLEVEHALSALIMEGYLKEDFHFTPYTTISYLVAGPRRLDAEGARALGEAVYVPVVLSPAKKVKKSRAKKRDRTDDNKDEEAGQEHQQGAKGCSGSSKKAKDEVNSALFELVCVSDSD